METTKQERKLEEAPDAELVGRLARDADLAEELLEALEWAAGLAYAGGKRVGDVEPVKSVLDKARR